MKNIYLPLLMIAFFVLPLCADDTQDMQETLRQLQQQLAEQQKKIAELEGQSIDVAKLLEQQRESEAEIYKAAKDIGQPDWLKGLDFYGDLRLRYEGKSYNGYNKAQKTLGSNKRKDWRNRARFRLRFGFTKQMMDDEMEVGFRLVSGDNDEPSSTNQTFTNQFSKKNLWIDRAYAKYTPKWLRGLTVIGGKMKTPMVHTNMLWDSDISPEGFWAEYKHKLGGGFTPFVGAGYFIAKENYKSTLGNSSHDCTMWDIQLGFDWKVNKDVKWTFAANYYDWDHYDTNYFGANGNDLPDMGGFQIINLTNKVKFKLFGMTQSAYFDFAHNCGDKDRNSGYKNQNNAYAVGYKLGGNKKKGDWSAGYKYAYIEANSVVGWFSDSDFGFANKKGHVIGAKYNLSNDITIGGKVFITESIAGLESGKTDITTQLDMVWKF